jgi:hypothetical protein
MVKSKNKQIIPSLVEAKFPMSDFDVHANSLLVNLIAIKDRHEQKFGVGRLLTLVNNELREKFWLQSQRVWVGQQSKDIEKFERAVHGMIRAYWFLESWALINGVDQMPEISVFEHLTGDGSVMVVAKSEMDAKMFEQFRGSRNCHVWTMVEIEELLKLPVLKDVVEAKRMYGHAKLVNLTGFDDMESDLDFSEQSQLPVMFNTKHAERFKDG